MTTKQTALVDQAKLEPIKPDGACVRFDECGNLTPGGTETNNRICDECLDKIRHAESASDG